MRIEIDAVGEHTDHTGARRCRMVVDHHGRLLDLSGLPGPLADPAVASIQWGPFGPNGEDMGRIFVRQANNAGSMLEVRVFSDFVKLKPYLDAFKAAAASS